MEWLLFLFALEVGYLPEIQFQEHYQPTEFSEGYYIQAEPEFVLFENLHVKGTIHIDMIKRNNNEVSFTPISLVSTVNIFYRFKQFDFGFIWKCGHPAVVWGNNNFPGQDTDHHYEAFYLRFDSRGNR